MVRPLVSIGIPTYNAARTLGTSLDSILRQSYENLEIIVCDNASTDDTVRLVEQFNDPRIRLHQHDKNIGAEKNLEAIWQLAQGDYVAIFHADDVYDPTIVEKEVSFLQRHPEAGAVATRSRFIDGSGNPQGLKRFPPSIEKSIDEVTLGFVDGFKLVQKYGNFIVCPSVMIRRECIEELQYWYHPMFETSGDLHVWFRIMENHEFGILLEPLMDYRRSEHSYSFNQDLLRTTEPVFFTLMRAYQTHPKLVGHLGPKDLRDLARLARRDAVIRAANHVIIGDHRRAVRLLREHWSPDVFLGVLEGRYRLRAMLAYVATSLAAFFPSALTPLAKVVSTRAMR